MKSMNTYMMNCHPSIDPSLNIHRDVNTSDRSGHDWYIAKKKQEQIKFVSVQNYSKTVNNCILVKNVTFSNKKKLK
jgi:hypothetical protein